MGPRTLLGEMPPGKAVMNTGQRAMRVCMCVCGCVRVRLCAWFAGKVTAWGVRVFVHAWDVCIRVQVSLRL